MKSPAVPAKRRHGGAGFALGCGCKDAKSVSVSASPSATTGTSTTATAATRSRSAGANPWASTTTDTLTTLTSVASSSLWEDAVAELGYKDGSCRMLPESGSGLLRELSELERSVASWGARKGHRREDKLSPPPRHEQRKAKGDGKVGDLRAAKEARFGDVDGDGGKGLEGSVAVVKQSEDPLADFRRSMLQMIVENGIVAGEDLREMLRRFLTLNAPHHHDTILRAFAEIWDDVFVAASLDCATPGRASSVPRREPGRTPAPMTPPRHRCSPPAWRV
ncbi:OFP transcription factor [Panicum miliaceum]|uniref:Transcription repressor n=1 Tax=Panicum miliaceum TaxID=4540 RepID=A0A3L6RUB8_PANMI|nr:OFP transcription factor [Panicum miliaceum]